MAQDINKYIGQVINYFSDINLLKIGGWILTLLIFLGVSLWAYFYYKNKKEYKLNVTAFEIIGDSFEASIRDKAKIVKLGKGGFAVIKLKKLKTWKIIYGDKVGRKGYYFFILPDNYWYQGKLSSEIFTDELKNGILSTIKIKSTNPLIRAQNSALEKQIDSLTKPKDNFWKLYGSWIMGITFVMIAGLFLWLIAKNISTVSGSFTGLIQESITKQDVSVQKLTELTDKITTVCLNGGSTSNGLVPI